MTEAECDKSLTDPPDQGYEKKKYSTIGSISSSPSCTIKLALQKNKNRLCAIKKFIRMDEIKEPLYFKREYNFLLQSRHPAILKLYDCGFPVSKRILKPFFEFEFVLGGTLDNFIQIQQTIGESCIPSPLCEIILYGISSGLAYIHQKKYVHRDIKPSNIFLNENYEPIIGDFGFARTIDEIITSSFPHTINYASPEVINKEQSNEKSDVYSFGMTLYEMRTLKRPYDKQPYALILTRIAQNKKPTLPETDPFYELFVECTQTNPAQRPSMNDVCNYIKNVASKISSDDFSIFEEYRKRIDNKKEISNDDPSQTLDKLKKLAMDGNPDSLYYLGWMNFKGVLVEKDILRSLELLQLAASSGHQNSKNALLKIFQSSMKEIKSDKKLQQLADEIIAQFDFKYLS